MEAEEVMEESTETKQARKGLNKCLPMAPGSIY